MKGLVDVRVWFLAVLVAGVGTALSLPHPPPRTAVDAECADCEPETDTAQQSASGIAHETASEVAASELAADGLFDTAGFPPRWQCGTWTETHGLVHIGSDVAIWIAYMAIPLALLVFMRKRGTFPFPGLLVLFASFILLCGITHLAEAMMFWWPAYRLMGALKLLTALVSVATVLALVPLVPRALALRSPAQLEDEVAVRTKELATQREELRQAKESAESATKAKSDFLANMSHEIRTPLTAILGYSDLFASGDADLEEVTTTIDRNGRHLLKLLNDILDFSKIEAGKLAVETSRLDIAATVADVARTMTSTARLKEIELRTTVGDGLPKCLASDPSRVQQILVNLVGNAIKFSRHGTVDLSVERRGDMVEFRVRDNGRGMTPDEAQRVFSAFEQADPSITREHGGTGLGLTISHSLAVLLGGSLRVASTERGEGTTMLLEIPLMEWTSEQHGADEDRTETDDGAPRLLGRRVLVVDDVPDNRLLAARILTREGALVEMAPDGVAARSVVERESAGGRDFDVILTDIQMPGLNGYELARALRSKGYAGVLAAFTASAMDEDRARCLESGCDFVVTKPIRRNQLVRDLLTLLSKK